MATAKSKLLGVNANIQRLIKMQFAKEGKEQMALESFNNSVEEYKTSLGKEKDLLNTELAILEVELLEAQRTAIPTESQVMRAKLEVKKAEQALDDKFEEGLAQATRLIVDAASKDGSVPAVYHKTLRRIELRDETLAQVNVEVRNLETAKSNLAAMSETSAVKALTSKIAAHKAAIEEIDAYLAA